VTYYVDDHKLFSSSGKYFPREGMLVDFNTWFIDLPFTGARTWDMKVNWFYYNAHQAMSAADVQNAVSIYNGNGMYFIDTVPQP
jgi:prolipoprotein diacylglyceryltransferase